MPFPSASMNHEASPLLNDHPPGQVHLVPENDAKEHVVNVTEVCWCQPQVQTETSEVSTHIHRPVLPVVRGHTLNLKKLLIGRKGDTDFRVELPNR